MIRVGSSVLRAGSDVMMSCNAPQSSVVIPFEPCLQTDSPARVDRKFEQAVKLAHVLGETRLNAGHTLREALCLDQRISLWDVISTFLVLYRFPLLFLPDHGRSAWMRRLAYRLRPYRGLTARFKDAVASDRRRGGTNCAEWSVGPRTVLFVCFTKSFYREVLQPVAHALATRGLAKVVVLHDWPEATVPAENGGVSFRSIREHHDRGVDEAQRRLMRDLRMLRESLFGKRQFDRLMDGVRSRVGDVNVRSEFSWLFWREFVRLAPHVALAELIMFRHRPAMIVSADDADQRCRVYSLMARAAGIPSLLIQQGLSFSDYPEWRFLSHDRVAAMGESSRRDLMAQGVDPERIVVTGHPGFDTFASTDPGIADKIRNDLGIPQEHRLVLFASQPSYVGAFDQPQKRTDMIKAVVKVVGAMKDVTLVIKPHPGEKRKELAALVGKARQVVLVDGAVSIAPLIKACDVFITFFSTTALQALYAGKPVISIDIPGSGGGHLYTDSQATWVARSPEELTEHVANLLSVNKGEYAMAKAVARQRFLREMACLPDGKATERIVGLVVDSLESERSADRPSQSVRAEVPA